MMKILILLTWTMEMKLIRKDDKYDEREVIILTYIYQNLTNLIVDAINIFLFDLFG